MDYSAIPNKKSELNYIYVDFVELSSALNDRRSNTTLSNLAYKNVYSILLDPESFVEQLEVLFIAIKCNSLV